MTLQDSERQTLSKLYMEKAQRALIDSEINSNSSPSLSVSRAYYSMFYAAQSALVQEGIAGLRRHEGVNNKFSDLFVKNGSFPNDLFRMMGRLEQARYRADYDPTAIISAQEAEESTEGARKFVAAVEHMMGKRLNTSRE